MATVAEVLARALNGAGIPRLFGLPGGETSQALDAFRREGLPFVLARHEAAAAFMAAATARLTRSVGACLTTLGPGAANVVVGLAHAYLDRSPVILVTGQMADRLRPGHTHQFLDLQALYAPISKASLQLTPANVQQKVAHALVLARQGRPGPVHLQLTNEDAVRPAEPEGPGAGRQTVLAQEAALNAAMEVLGRARRPVLICGLGLEPEGPYREVLSLAEALHSPVITTPKAKGALPAAHPLSAGVIGLTQTDPAYAVLQEADCVLAVGFDPVELVRPWGHPAPLLWIAPWENADPALPAAAEIVGGLAPALIRLMDARPAADCLS